MPQCKNLDILDEILESTLLFHSKLGDLIVGCFVPSSGFLSVVNRLERRGIFADPNLERCKAVVAALKAVGLNVEQLS